MNIFAVSDCPIEFANVTVFPDLPVHEAYVRHLRAKQGNAQLRIM